MWGGLLSSLDMHPGTFRHAMSGREVTAATVPHNTEIYRIITILAFIVSRS
jgi:hypothetical protein